MADSFNSPNDPRIYRSSSFHPPEPVEANDLPAQAQTTKPKWVVNLVLFLITTLTVFWVGSAYSGTTEATTFAELFRPANLLGGWTFAVPLLSILLAHEFGHYIAAKIHGVPASLPYFIPFPLPPFGTMGAVIAMKGRIASRKALLDIGASGPLAGMAVAIPVLVWGLLHSEVKLVVGSGFLEGQCLLYMFLKRITVGTIPEGHDVFLHPSAIAGWAGIFVTMINLLPVGQLDGGHIAYALFGPIHNKIARVVHFALPTLFVYNLASNLIGFAQAGTLSEDGNIRVAIENSLFWLLWFFLLFVLRRVGGRDHPPTEPGPLGTSRTAIAVVSLILFVLLFMPTPMSMY